MDRMKLGREGTGPTSQHLGGGWREFGKMGAGRENPRVGGRQDGKKWKGKTQKAKKSMSQTKIRIQSFAVLGKTLHLI